MQMVRISLWRLAVVALLAVALFDSPHTLADTIVVSLVALFVLFVAGR